MTDLKTLKDIECEHCPDFETGKSCICTDLKEPLRQEAIKWIKEYEKLRFAAFEKGMFGAEAFYRGHMVMLEKFFNIIEEDLK